MYSIGVIGDYDSICGFSALGFDIFPVESAERARKELRALAGGGYGIIYITEPFVEELEADCALYEERPVPCVIPIPACTAALGAGEARLKRYVERAVGSDIIFGEQ
ncbi:MAG: V-type ATP synthase subunit F [Oscillospiraceae bacterium]|nr:V-type ATP synthase subunit F [Oscillospiraceae bacterium]